MRYGQLVTIAGLVFKCSGLTTGYVSMTGSKLLLNVIRAPSDQ